MNVTDVAKANDLVHKLAVEKWAVSVWNAWSKHHDTIKYFTYNFIVPKLKQQ